MAEQKRVLIIGGGFAGLSAARELSGSFQVTVIDPKTCFEYTPAAPCNFLHADSAAKSLVEYPAGTGVTYRQGLIAALTTDGTTGEATLQGGDKVAFDYALIAAGSSYPSAIKPNTAQLSDRAGRLHEFADVRSKIEAANTVVVVGGGSVGVEVAAEVAEAFPDKKVTLVAAGGLVDRMDPKAQAFAADWLKQHGVEVVTGERISDWGGLGDGEPAAATLKTDKDRILQADLVFKCVGVKPATALFAASLSTAQLARGGSVAVEPTLQVVGWRNVFSAGDVTDVKEEKTAGMAGLSAGVAARNIRALDQGKELQRYPECFVGAGAAVPVVGGFTLGSKAGVFQIGSDVQTGGSAATIKSFIQWLYVRVAAGSRVWGWIYRQLTKGMISGLAKESKKAAAAAGAKAAAATA